MIINKEQILESEIKVKKEQEDKYSFLAEILNTKGINVNGVIQKLVEFQVAVPSWALGAGGTRFGRFGYGGEPANLEQKIQDVGILHALTDTAGAILS